MWRFTRAIVISLAMAGVCCAQMQRLDRPKLVPLRLIITVDGDVDKAAYATVELMDALGTLCGIAHQEHPSFDHVYAALEHVLLARGEGKRLIPAEWIG